MSSPAKSIGTVPEAQIEEVIAAHFAALYGHRVTRQCRVYERSIDVLVSTGEELWAIEAKLADWRRAIAQAEVNLAAAHRSFIAIHRPNVHRVDPAVLERKGIGLISVGSQPGECEILRDARPSPFLNRLMAERLLARLEGRS
jgi:hypothetical protein